MSAKKSLQDFDTQEQKQIQEEITFQFANHSKYYYSIPNGEKYSIVLSKEKYAHRNIIIVVQNMKLRGIDNSTKYYIVLSDLTESIKQFLNKQKDTFIENLLEDFKRKSIFSNGSYVLKEQVLAFDFETTKEWRQENSIYVERVKGSNDRVNYYVS